MTSKDLLKVSVVLTLVASASTAFAASDITGSTTIGTGTFTPSANVHLQVASGSSSYAATSQHLSGDRVFFGSNSDPKIYYTTKATGSTTALPSSLDSTTSVSSTWSSL